MTADREQWPDPPEPHPERWAEVRDRIAARLPAAKGCGCGWKWWAGGTATVLAAGVAVWLAWPKAVPPQPASVEPPPAAVVSDPLAEYDVLPVATADDVMVHVVRGGSVKFGSIRHPVPDALPLAGMADVTVVKGPAAGELSCPEVGDAAVYVMPER